MRRRRLVAILWLIAILCLIPIIVGILLIGPLLEQSASWGEGLLAVVILIVVSFFTNPELTLLVICLVPVFVVGALISVFFALWVAYTPHKKSNLTASQTQTEGSSSESPRTQPEENSKESGPPPLPLPRRPR